MMRRLITVAACAAAAAFVPFERASTQGGDVIDRDPVDCISLRRVRSTTVVDDRTILFYMRGRTEAYLNELPRECRRLSREERFSYQSRTGRLCDADTITVLESFGGRFQRGATCPLGRFAPITRAEADALAEGPEGARRDAQVGVEEVELPDDDESASDESDEGGDSEE